LGLAAHASDAKLKQYEDDRDTELVRDSSQCTLRSGLRAGLPCDCTRPNLVFIILGLRGIEWANLGNEGARKLCIS